MLFFSGYSAEYGVIRRSPLMALEHEPCRAKRLPVVVSIREDH